MRKSIIHILAFCFLLPPALSAQTVHLLSLDGAINPASTEYINNGIKTAASKGSECVIIQLNTPGGLLKSTRMIVSSILTAEIPVVVYVSPAGSQAASAGVFITLAAHVAVMAPGTNIGAAHPVSLQGQQDSIMMEKATNDAAAFIRTISEKRHRNVKWAEDAVRKSLSITENEALKENVIDTVVGNIESLLSYLDGRKIETESRVKTMHTRGAEIIRVDKTTAQEILDILSDPNIAYLLLMLGMYGLLFEIYNPGSIFPGVVGVISIILALYSLHTLPINYAGLALIIFAIILFILEVNIASHGMLTVGGIVCLVLGSIMLVDPTSALEVVDISWTAILSVVIVTVLFFLFAIGFGIKAQRRKPTTGVEGIVGEAGEAISDLRPEGQIRVHGEIWNAESLDGTLKRGTRVVVSEVDNLRLRVRKAAE